MPSESSAQSLHGRVPTGFAAWLREVQTLMQRSMESYRAEAELRRMNDRQLADIGLKPDDIGRAVRGRIPGVRPRYSWQARPRSPLRRPPSTPGWPGSRPDCHA